MKSCLEQFRAQSPVLTDGAWGTQLQTRGLGPGECPDAWNLSHPSEVEAIARGYVEAGSKIILTNTFRSNRLGLTRYGLAGRVEELNRAGVVISRRAANGRARIFGSVGPSGTMLLTGETSEEQLRQVYFEQARILAETGVEGFVIETMSDLTEARLALAATCATGLPVVASMVFDSGKNRDRTMMGVTPEMAARDLAAGGADVIGANCGIASAAYVTLCARLHAATDRPIWIKLNAGLPALVDDKPVYETSPEEFAQFVPKLVEAGASFVGGCCGTDPEFIRAMRKEIERWKARFNPKSNSSSQTMCAHE